MGIPIYSGVHTCFSSGVGYTPSNGPLSVRVGALFFPPSRYVCVFKLTSLWALLVNFSLPHPPMCDTDKDILHEVSALLVRQTQHTKIIQHKNCPPTQPNTSTIPLTFMTSPTWKERKGRGETGNPRAEDFSTYLYHTNTIPHLRLVFTTLTWNT